MNPSKPAQKILVIRFSSLGDVILTTALYPNLKAAWPNSEISVLTKRPYAPVFDNNPYVDWVHVVDTDKQTLAALAQEIELDQYDLIIDLHNNLRSWRLRSLSKARQVAVNKATWARLKKVWFKRDSKVLERSVRDRILDCLDPLGVPKKQTETQLYLKPNPSLMKTFSLDSGVRLLGLAPGAKHNTKRWPADNFIEAGNRLGEIPNTFIVVLGDKSDQEVASYVTERLTVPCRNLAGWTSLPELFFVVSKLTFLLTNDSGLLHVGEALKIPLVALFGPTVRAFGFAPYRDTSRVVEVNSLPCRPCTLHGTEVCPLKHHRCMTDLDLNAVLLTASHLLDQASVPVDVLPGDQA